MNYATIKKTDVANGPGVRVSLFVSGCTHHCKGCFNSEAWDFHYGQAYTEETEQEILQALVPDYIRGLSLLGGEPMEPENRGAVLSLVKKVREQYPQKTIWCYTGDTLDALMPGGAHRTDVTDRLLACIDILVDGPFVQDLHDISLRFRGSSNQRIIDMNATRARAASEGVSLADAVELWHDEAVYSTHTMK